MGKGWRRKKRQATEVHVPGSGGRSLRCGLKFVALLRGYIDDGATKAAMKACAFELPYNQATIESIQARECVREPPPYKKIGRNIFLSAKPPIAAMPVHRCDCNVNKEDAMLQKSTSTRINASSFEAPNKAISTRDSAKREQVAGCGETCINRMMFIECNADICSHSNPDECSNRQFSKRNYKKTNLQHRPGKGFGLMAGEFIKAGEFVIEYAGEIIDDVECEARMIRSKALGERHFYMMELGREVVVDARYKGNVARFINHSCQPNCHSVKWNVDGHICVGIFALEDIAVGEELSFDYRFSHFGEQQACRCGAPNCTGIMGGKTKDKKNENAGDDPMGAYKLLEKPISTTSLSLLRRSVIVADEVNEKGYTGSRLFVSGRVSEVGAVQSGESSSESKQKGNSWYQHALSLLPNELGHRCGGILDWSEEMSSEIGTERNISSAMEGKMTKSTRKNLLKARLMRLKDIEAFAHGNSKWNKKHPRKNVQATEMIIRIIDNIESGKITNADGGDLNEDSCYKCAQTGELICCDGCPAAYHITCAGLFMLPGNDDLWFCPACKQRKRVNSMISSTVVSSRTQASELHSKNSFHTNTSENEVEEEPDNNRRNTKRRKMPSSRRTMTKQPVVA